MNALVQLPFSRPAARISVAGVFAVAVHAVIFFVLIQNTPALHLTIENGVQAFNMQQVSLRMHEPKTKPQTKPAQPEAPTIQAKNTKPKPQHIAHKQATVQPAEPVSQAIPVVQNPSFEGVRKPPIYPKRALRLRQQGVVRLKTLVSASGVIERIEIEKTSGYAMLDQSAIDAVEQWKFKPTMIDGKAVLSWIEVPVEFKLL